jgi:hypothetical protein
VEAREIPYLLAGTIVVAGRRYGQVVQRVTQAITGTSAQAADHVRELSPAARALLLRWLLARLRELLAEPALQQLGAEVMASETATAMTRQFLDTDAMQLIVDYIAHSQAVREVLAEQTAGIADDMADGLRERTVKADDAVEHWARALLRRPRRDGSAHLR